MKTKNKNRYSKVFVSVLILIATLIGIIIFIRSNKKEVPNPYVPLVYKFGPYIVSVKEDKRNNIINLILKEGEEETIIESIELDNTFKGTFSKFLTSSNNKYLHYVASLNLDYYQSRIYNIENKKKINLGITAFDNGFTSDNKYFYGCSEDGLFDGGVEIYNLEQMKVEYRKPYGLMKCEYDSQNNILKVTYNDNINKDFQYSFDSGKIVN